MKEPLNIGRHVIEAFEIKNWAVYEIQEENKGGLEQVYRRGRQKTGLVFGVQYMLAPLIEDDSCQEKVEAEISNCIATNQTPRYNGVLPEVSIDSFMFEYERMLIILTEGSGYTRICVPPKNVKRTIEDWISDYDPELRQVVMYSTPACDL